MPVDERALQHSLQSLAASISAPAVTLSDQLRVVVSAAAELFSADCVGVLLLDDADHIRTVAVSGPAAAALEVAQEHLQRGPGVDVLTAGRVLAVADLATDPEYRELWPPLAGAGVRGVLSAPVMVGDEIAGNLNAVTGQRHHWSEAERRAGAAFAGLIGELLRAASSSTGRPETSGPDHTASDRETGEPGT